LRSEDERFWERTPKPRNLLPDDLEQTAPGPELADVLASIDREALNGYELIVLLTARARQIASMQAALYADMMALAHCPAGDRYSPPQRIEALDEFAADEIRAALTLTRKAADHRFGLAYQLVERLPGVWQALSRGLIDIA
jgi:hypothetical protein